MFRPQIRADLFREYGVDLAEWWTDRRWRGLLELIDMLPTASLTREAVVNDPEAAQYMAEARWAAENSDEQGEPWAPRVAEWDLHAALLRDLIQTVTALQETVYSGFARRKPPASQRYPYPRTEVDRIYEAMNRQWAVDLLAQFGFDESDF